MPSLKNSLLSTMVSFRAHIAGSNIQDPRPSPHASRIFPNHVNVAVVQSAAAITTTLRPRCAPQASVPELPHRTAAALAASTETAARRIEAFA
ncbi:hypothetical protein PSPO01_02892 [Paraphaeosphaeria sporulosa]